MIISVNGHEKKIAILDNGRVTEFYIERGEENTGVVGNIYKGRVMRVLPGMQSAFVEVGLERDAFLYVSDFFDEEEEIERIVMEKGKKTSKDEADPEVTDQLHKERLKREKLMEEAQEIAEPLAESGGEMEEPDEEEPAIEKSNVEEPAEESQDEPQSKRGRSRRGKKGKQQQEEREAQPKEERSEKADGKIPEPEFQSVTDYEEGFIEEAKPDDYSLNFEYEDSNFQRIIDDEDTGEMFKDAYMQEAIVDKVRAVEFDMESTGTAEVGSLFDSVSDQSNRFQRIADEDETSPSEEETSSKKRSSRRGSKKKSANETAESGAAETVESETTDATETDAKPSKKSSRRKSSAKETDDAQTSEAENSPNETGETTKKSSRSRGRKSSAKNKTEDSNETPADAQASVGETEPVSEMAVRRGGRGRRRGGRGREDGEGGDGNKKEDRFETSEASEAGYDDSERSEVEFQPAASPILTTSRRGGNERNDRNERTERSDRNDRAPRNERSDRNDRGNRRDRSQPTITDLLREGQEILVQIAKEPIARKGARITSHIALPGRHLVYMPTIEHLGVSRKIESASERGRLRKIIQTIRQTEDIPSGGFIVRTAGTGVDEEALRQDARYLVRTWQDVKKHAEKSKSPALVHQDLDLIQRLLRDQMSDDFTAVRVDSEEEYLRIVEFMNRVQPKMVKRVKLYTRDEPILEAFGVHEEIEKALKPRVWLKSGGYLVINQTEALVAIDVNTGKFVGKGNARLEDTITKTNMEAVDEIARQIRLRDLGGIIVLDLIDMEDRRNRHKVQQALQEALASDKSPTKVLSFNDFGLIIMTRKRVKQSLERTMCSPCEYCEGAGWVKSAQTVCYEILDEARRLSKNADDVRRTTIRVHPEVAKILRGEERLVMEEIEDYLGDVDINSDKSVHQTQFDFAFI